MTMQVEKLEIKDSDVFDTGSKWYARMVELRQLHTNSHHNVHRHHWIPCYVVFQYAKRYYEEGVPYREFADRIFPQEPIRLSPQAHTLMHFLIWNALKDRYKGCMKKAFERMVQECPCTSEPYASALAEYIQEAYDDNPINKIPVYTGIHGKQLRHLCHRTWIKDFKGVITWPKFQHHFMRKCREANEALDSKKWKNKKPKDLMPTKNAVIVDAKKKPHKKHRHKGKPKIVYTSSAPYNK